MNFKIPSIAGAVFFILFFLINLAQGNSFFVIFTRSLFSGAAVFGFLFGAVFLLKNVLKIDLSASEESSDGDADAKGENVDISIDEKVDPFDYNNYNDDKSDSTEIAEESETSDYENKNDANDGENQNFFYSDKFSDLDEKIDNVEDITALDESTSSMGSENEYSYDNDSDNSATLKEKLGYEATNEELARAVQTMIKRDKS
ncbi:MAG TPA: hypothetical protein PK385_10910 [Spirochaetota bacterium]|nr:hypothetical protein [Spirochaetota bacterium]HOS33558.1 hypothetical protein [Spirochaetota bacterium]HOS56556.1 hypothetical protein [Spirochaetota bacterium]HPK62125.1 hypothetical protein [Spirochaetota bacterium]HQF78861.1 hypothetical protein [Spirochaetota bacterium]